MANQQDRPIKSPDEVKNQLQELFNEQAETSHPKLIHKVAPELQFLGKNVAEDVAFENKFAELMNREFRQEELRRLRDDNEGRKSFRNKIFMVMVIWMFFVLAVVVLCAAGQLRLSDTVLITLISTTTANVIGVFLVVVNYLFNRDKST